MFIIIFQPPILSEDVAQILGKCTAEIEQHLHAMNLSQTSPHGLAIVGLLDVLLTARTSRDSVALARVVHKVRPFVTERICSRQATFSFACIAMPSKFAFRYIPWWWLKPVFHLAILFARTSKQRMWLAGDVVSVGRQPIKLLVFFSVRANKFA